MTIESQDIRRRLLGYLEEEVDCQPLTEDADRIGCLTPLEYPDGDGVAVWVRAVGDAVEITDYGEGLSDDIHRTGKDEKGLAEAAIDIARIHGVDWLDEGRLSARCEPRELGEWIWRVATASAQVAQVAVASRPKPRQVREREFTDVVDHTLRERKVPIERERKLTGASGHTHRATIFIPTTHAIIEPIEARGHWNQAAATYVKFGDLSRANGYRRFSLIDDREEAPEDDVESLLLQVSDVLAWSRHDAWLETLQSPT